MSRREDLVAALTNAEENGGALSDDFVPPSATEPHLSEAPTEISAAESGERPRDNAGRFAARNEKPETPTRSTGAPETPQPPTGTAPAAPDARPEPPKSWKADMRANWDKLDPTIAGYINQREQEIQRGVDEYRAKAEPALSLYQEVAPYVQAAVQRGLTQQQFVADAKDLFYTRDLLMNADPQTKLQTIVNIAHAAGLNLAGMLGGQVQAPTPVDPNTAALNQRLQGLEGMIRGQQEAEQQRMQNEIETEIGSFANSHPHFEVLRETMGSLIQSGMASDLDSAYSKALRLHDDLFQQDQAQQREAAEKNRRAEADKAAKAAKANAVSTRSATPGAVAAATSVAPKGRRAALSEAFDGIQAGRI